MKIDFNKLYYTELLGVVEIKSPPWFIHTIRLLRNLIFPFTPWKDVIELNKNKAVVKIKILRECKSLGKEYEDVKIE